MSNTSKRNQRTSAESQRTAVATRRASARRLREQKRQRLIITVAASAVGVALLALLVGVLYDQVYTPSQPVARVGTTTLSRGDYTNVRRQQIAADINSTLDLIYRFGNQFGDQFAQRVPQLNAEADPRTLRSAPVDDPTVNAWVEQRLIERGAANLNLSASDGEVAQLLVSALNQTFPPQATAPVTGTAAATAAATASASAPVTSTDTITAEPTLEPTPTIAATPSIEDATQQEADAIRRLYDGYTAQIVNARPNLSTDDFRDALRQQYRRQVLTQKVQGQLVKDEGFEVSTEPTSIEVRQILVKVETPEGATDAERDAAFEQRRAAAETILQEVKSGADFAKVAAERSDDATSKTNGGLLTSFDPTGKTQDGTQIDPAFLEAALKLTEPKQIADQLVRTPFGWHIIQLERRIVPTKEDQISEARTKAFDTWLAEQRAQGGVELFPPQTPTATAEPTVEGTAQPLPTAPLGGVPTVVSDTTTLTDTGALTTQTPAAATEPASTSTPTPAATAAATSAATATP